MDSDSEFTYIIEQYIEGESLKSFYLRKAVDEQQLLDHLGQICSILNYLHDKRVGVLHLDLKPENIIISSRIYLLDFGSAAYDGDVGSSGFATQKYCAPERKLKMTPGKEADIYSLGVLIRFMLEHTHLTGRTARSLSKVADKCCIIRKRRRIGSEDILIGMLRKVTDKKQVYREFGENTLRGRKVAFVGLGRGCGTTHISIAFANYIAMGSGNRVIYAQQNSHDDIRFLFAEGAAHEHGNVVYVQNDIELCDVQKEEDVVVADFGGDPVRVIQQARGYDMVVFVGGGAPWRRKDYFFPERLRTQECVLPRTFILVNQGSVSTAGETITKEYRTFEFPYEVNPLKPGPQTIKIFGKMVDES